ncbi:MAG: sugar transferase [Gammaproteobacteria bacterium]|nr:sugar transferase [Gammaproteobacteria bacterium]
MSRAATPPTSLTILHVVYHFGVGGLENGVVNLINRLPRERFRHHIVSLTDYTDFSRRIERDDVQIHALHKRPGHDWRLYLRLYRLFRRLRPDIVHSRNLAAMEAQLPAWLAGVPCRIHGEHGRDVLDVDGTNRKYILQRRLLRPFIHHFIALSRDLERYLDTRIGVQPARLTRIINGVDIGRFHPDDTQARARLPAGFAAADSILIGTVGRLAAIKDQLSLVRAFVRLQRLAPEISPRLRLVLIGEGGERARLEQALEASGLLAQTWLAGARNDVAELLPALDLFVLPSLAEGISNTLMEAMACGLPVIATDVGGNAELVLDGETGALVPRGDPEALALALKPYVQDAAMRERQGRAGRRRAETEFSLERMVERYRAVYEQQCAGNS